MDLSILWILIPSYLLCCIYVNDRDKEKEFENSEDLYSPLLNDIQKHSNNLFNDDDDEDLPSYNEVCPVKKSV
jgi:hypothetical protein